MFRPLLDESRGRRNRRLLGAGIAVLIALSQLKDLLGLSRNPFDRVGHFLQGFVPAIVARELLQRAQAGDCTAGRLVLRLHLADRVADGAAMEAVPRPGVDRAHDREQHDERQR